MLVIREAQMVVLGEARRRGFEERLLAHVREVFPDLTRDADATRAVVRRGMEKAEGYGMETERDVATFVDVVVALGADFDEKPELARVTSILRDEGMDASARIGFAAELLVSMGQARPAEEDDA